MSVKNVIEEAKKRIGYSEYPAFSNNTIFGEEYGWNGVPWCVIFLWYCFRKGGEKQAFYGGAKTASCSYLMEYYQKQKRTCDPMPGAIAFYNFSGGTSPEHCGIIVGKGDGYFWSIEGNTSPSDTDSQDSGGCVAMKRRYPDQIVACAMPAYSSDFAGHWAESSIKWAITSGIMVGYPDGTFQPDTPVTRAELATALERMVKNGK